MTEPAERAWRAEFPITERLLYLNNCSLTPLPRRGEAALREYAKTWSELGGRAWYDHWIEILDALREEFADVLGADGDEVALEPAVSAALVTIASSFDYAKRPKVIVSDLDFPTDGHAFLAVAGRGARVEFVRSPDRIRVPLELFERAVDETTAASRWSSSAAPIGSGSRSSSSRARSTSARRSSAPATCITRAATSRT